MQRLTPSEVQLLAARTKETDPDGVLTMSDRREVWRALGVALVLAAVVEGHLRGRVRLSGESFGLLGPAGPKRLVMVPASAAQAWPRRTLEEAIDHFVASQSGRRAPTVHRVVGTVVAWHGGTGAADVPAMVVSNLVARGLAERTRGLTGREVVRVDPGLVREAHREVESQRARRDAFARDTPEWFQRLLREVRGALEALERRTGSVWSSDDDRSTDELDLGGRAATPGSRRGLGSGN